MSLTIALAQCNFTVGDIAANVAKISEAYSKAAKAKADLVVFSEMSITGYPPEDLVLRKRFQEAAMQAAIQLSALTKDGPAMLVGGLWREETLLHNTAFLMEDGVIAHRQYKCHLPNYGVFDEMRVFAPGVMPEPIMWRGVKLGILICEDMWLPDISEHLHGRSELLISLNASPYEMGKSRHRMQVAKARVRETKLPLIYVNQIGGQDELVFDGRSFVLSAECEVRTRLAYFGEDSALTHWHQRGGVWDCDSTAMPPAIGEEETIYNAMKLGLRDYVEKNRFPGVVLGLSGGVDSALTAAVAVDALGASRVRALMMPSPHTSKESIEDANACARLLGIQLDTIAIQPGMQAFDQMLAPVFAGKPHDTTEENIQSRLRGNLLMAFSNKHGHLVLTTGNKSEMSVGYATLYGDMCGGYSVLKDVYKTTIYKICNWRNKQSSVMPERVITKAPSAELKPNQTDQDTLPPYDVLDAILLRLVEYQLSAAEIVAQGYAQEVVEKVARMLYGAEYKRRQAPPGVKITGMSFGRDRRYPLTNGWRN